MKLDDNWFINSMLLKTLSKTENIRTQSATPATDSGKIFATILNNIIEQMQVESTEQSILQPGVQSAFQPSLQPVNQYGVQPTLSSGISEIAPEINTYSAGQSYTLNNNEPLRFKTMSPEKLNQVLNGKLTGMGDAFIRAGQQFNINPALLAAIAQHETGNGKSPAAVVKNNIAGMMGQNGLKSYSTIEESIFDMARNLSKNYLGNGLTSISKIGAKYAPQGAANDPTGLNNYWVSGVSRYFNQFRV
ncbi:glucosaminidase domain-containing protein [Bacillus salipaludis]|uniref:glucosaminidase domain-containing protein n=1 Tax=Bacillus salipaludis TaxID=2547811 RepID=UPI003D199799